MEEPEPTQEASVEQGGGYQPSSLVPSGFTTRARIAPWRAEAVAQALHRVRHVPGVPNAIRALRLSLSGNKGADKGQEATVLWRGMGNMCITPRFMVLGGTELACCSATSQLEIAARYSQWGSHALLFRIRSTTFMNLGCDISDLSAFPHEHEFLYPPLSFLHPNGVTHTLKRVGIKYTIVEVEPSFPAE